MKQIIVMQRSLADENYLKAIFHLSGEEQAPVGTGMLADFLEVRAASVTDKMKRLQKKGLLDYQKSKGAALTEAGEKIALLIIRKHRLWEQFLVEVLGFDWHEVHDIAEQLEHIHSEELINRIDQYLGHPKEDPHGDPIPDADGKISQQDLYNLDQVATGASYQIITVESRDAELLQFLDKKGLNLHTTLTLIQRETYDRSIIIEIQKKSPINLSRMVAKKIWVSPATQKKEPTNAPKAIPQTAPKTTPNTPLLF